LDEKNYPTSMIAIVTRAPRIVVYDSSEKQIGTLCKKSLQ